MYTQTFIAAALAGLSVAVPLIQRDASEPFFVQAINSGTVVQNSAINANDGRYWIGKPTSTFCPDVAECPDDVNVTALVFNGGSVFPDVEVPGGQQVYVTSDGQLGFTTAHSNAIPEGALSTGFAYSGPTELGQPGSLTFDDSDFNACPSGDGIYQVYAYKLNPSEDCIGIALSAFNYGGSAAWQYQ